MLCLASVQWWYIKQTTTENSAVPFRLAIVSGIVTVHVHVEVNECLPLDHSEIAGRRRETHKQGTASDPGTEDGLATKHACLSSTGLPFLPIWRLRWSARIIAW